MGRRNSSDSDASMSRSRGGRRDSSSDRSRSRGRPSSRGRSPARGSDKAVLKLTNDDAAFVLGSKGKTKDKIAIVSGAKVDLENLDLTIQGSVRQVARAKKYAQCLIDQRTGPVTVHENMGDGDLTLIDVPQEAVGFVTGRGGNFLRDIEGEWKTLMFFANYDGSKGRGRDKQYEKLAIFGDRRGRRGAELKVLSAVETKCPGYYEKHKDEVDLRDQEGEWRTDVLPFKDDELSFALGKKGATRRKLEASSGCIVQYIGNHALFSGNEEQRSKVKQYMSWLFDQLDGPVMVDDWRDRDDCTVMDIPGDCVGYITGTKRAALSRIEEDFGVLMFFMGSKRDNAASEKLAIFGPKAKRVGAELKVMSSVEGKSPGHFSQYLKENRDKWDKKGFHRDVMSLAHTDVGYILGKGGSTRMKLASASGACLQYVGDWAIIAGEHKHRQRCREYLDWLLKQKDGKIVVDSEDREDCLEVDVPHECIGWVTGRHGEALREVERETDTFCFLASDNNNKERLLIFGCEEGRSGMKGRIAAKKLVLELVAEKQDMDRNGGRRRSRDSRPRSYGKGGGYGKGRGRGDSRGRGRGGRRDDSRRGRGRGRSDSRRGRGRGGRSRSGGRGRRY